MLTTNVQEVRAVVDAGAEWVHTRDIPDPVGWADLRFGASQLTELLGPRLRGAASPTRVHTLPFPKGLSGENRPWVMANPIDEVAYRLLGGRLIEFSEGALGPEVLSYRARVLGPGWRTKSFKYGGRLRRAAVSAPAGAAFVGVGALDIRNYYPSLQIPVVIRPLDAAGAPRGATRQLERILSHWQSTWDVAGIPIGPEASGLLGNLGLVSVDEVVRTHADSFTRMTDDYTVVCSSRTFADLTARVVDAAGELGLELNAEKIHYFENRSELPLNLFDPEIDALLPILTHDRARGIMVARRLLEIELASDSPSPSRVRFCLGVLASARDDLPLRLVTESPNVMRLAPRGFGRYLRGMIERRAVDEEWLVDLAIAKPTPTLAAVQYHLLLACSEFRLSKNLAEGIQDFALSPGSWTPLRCAASEAWAASERARDTTAIQGVLDVGDVSHRRAITLGLRHMNASKHRDRLLSQVESDSPDLGPTVSWIKAGAPRAA